MNLYNILGKGQKMDLIKLAAMIAKKLSDPEDATTIDEWMGKAAPYRISGSLTKFLKPYVIEPFIIVSNDINMDIDSRDVIIKYCVNVFATFYLQVFKIMTAVNGFTPKLTFRLMKSNPGNDNISFTFATEDMANEISFYFRDIDFGMESSNSSNRKTISSSQETSDAVKGKDDGRIYTKNTKNGSSQTMESSISVVDKDESLSAMFSKLLEVKISFTSSTNNNNKDYTGATNNVSRTTEQVISIPISIMPTINISNINSIIKAFDRSNLDHTFLARLNALRAGSISWWNFITANDLAKKYKEKRFKDITDSRILDTYTENEMKNVSKLLGGGKGFSDNYNMLVVTLDELEQIVNMHSLDIIKKYTERQKWMDASKMMMIFALDTNTQIARVFISDFKEPYIISLKSLDTRKKEPDYNSAISALLVGKAPMF